MPSRSRKSGWPCASNCRAIGYVVTPMQEALQLKRLANKRAPPWLFLHEYTVKPPLVRAEAGRINDALNYLALPSLIRVKQLFLLILVDFSMA